MAATGAVLLGAFVTHVVPTVGWAGFRGLDALQNGFTQACNLAKYQVLQGTVDRVLGTVARVSGAEVNHWGERVALFTQPLPSLAQTAERARIVFKRILPSSEHERVDRECDALVSEAYGLQLRLMALGVIDSWINTPWQTGAYSYNPNPLRGESSEVRGSHWVGFGRDDGVEDYSSFKDPLCVRGGVLLNALLNYRTQLLAGTTNEGLVFRFKGKRIDGESCLNAFSFRLPGEEIDTYRCTANSTHVMINVNGYYYPLDLVESGTPKSPERLAFELRKIADDGNGKQPLTNDVAVLSTGDRREWHAQRKELLRSDTNAASFESVESALCIIYLDQEDAWTTRADAAKYAYQKRDRSWDDVTLGIRVRGDGKDLVCVCGHGNVDATGVAPVLESIFKQAPGLKGGFDEDKAFEAPDPSPLEFELEFSIQVAGGSSTVTKQVNLTGAVEAMKIKPMNAELKTEEIEYRKFTKEKCKKAKLNPDGVVQQAFQLAWAKTFSKSGVGSEDVLGAEAYEAVSMRAYQRSRTDQVHPFTPESKNYVAKVQEEQEDLDGEIDALTEAVRALDLQKTTVMRGGGHDRHLFALYALAKRYGVEVPLLETYIDQVFQYKLSTSQLPQDIGTGGCFLPTAKDGIGIFYPIAKPDAMRFYLTSYLPAETLSLFKDNLVWALDQQNRLLDEIVRKQAIDDVD